MILLFAFSLVFMQALEARASYQSQEIKPSFISTQERQSIRTGRTYNQFQGSRSFAPKKKTYPILEQFEELLYPRKDFSEENPGKRLERLEIACFGARQTGSIPQRLANLKNEIESWQIANEQAMNILNSKNSYRKDLTQAQAFNYQQAATPQSPASTQVPQAYYQQPYYPAQTRVSSQVKKKDYDYMKYRMAAPVIQSVARRSFDLLFHQP